MYTESHVSMEITFEHVKHITRRRMMMIQEKAFAVRLNKMPLIPHLILCLFLLPLPPIHSLIVIVHSQQKKESI